MDLNDGGILVEGQTWHVGDLLVLRATSMAALLTADGHLVKVADHDEPLIFLGAEGEDTRRVVKLLSVRFGLCWRYVWPYFSEGMSLVQSLDMNPGTFRA